MIASLGLYFPARDGRVPVTAHQNVVLAKIQTTNPICSRRLKLVIIGADRFGRGCCWCCTEHRRLRRLADERLRPCRYLIEIYGTRTRIFLHETKQEAHMIQMEEYWMEYRLLACRSCLNGTRTSTTTGRGIGATNPTRACPFGPGRIVSDTTTTNLW